MSTGVIRPEHPPELRVAQEHGAQRAQRAQHHGPGQAAAAGSVHQRQLQPAQHGMPSCCRRKQAKPHGGCRQVLGIPHMYCRPTGHRPILLGVPTVWMLQDCEAVHNDVVQAGPVLSVHHLSPQCQQQGAVAVAAVCFALDGMCACMHGLANVVHAFMRACIHVRRCVAMRGGRGGGGLAPDTVSSASSTCGSSSAKAAT